jgi:hypothetical protein
VLQVSLNAQQYTGELTYTYHGGVAVLALSPNSGPELGGTHVVVSGKELELGSHYVCRFNATVVPASLLPSSLTQYVAFTERHIGAAVTASHRAQVNPIPNPNPNPTPAPRPNISPNPSPDPSPSPSPSPSPNPNQGTYAHRTLGTRAHDCVSFDSDDAGDRARISYG